MKRAAILTLFLLPILALSARAQESERNWPQWRGPHATGSAPQSNPPTEWSETKNVRWKVEIPGKGHASPIVWGDRVFVLSVIDTGKEGEAKKPAEEPKQPQRQGRRGGRGGRGGWPPKSETKNIHQFAVVALSRADGSTLWQRAGREELPHASTHEEGSWASSSPATDGERVYASFGSGGVYCFDMNGELKWEKDFGRMRTKMTFGEGSSLCLYGDAVILQWDHEDQSFIVALDKKTGKELWKTDRDEDTAWATPLVANVAGKPQVITSATSLIRSYDLASGELLWQCAGMTMNAIPSPVAFGDLVLVGSGFRGAALLAIRPAGAEGDITGSDAVVWSFDQATPYVPSLLRHGELLYFLEGNKGVLSCLDAKTGVQHYLRAKLEGLKTVFASPVGAGDRVYVVGKNGVSAVVKAGPAFEVLASNTLEDAFTASPAVAGDELYLRGHKNLYCIARPATDDADSEIIASNTLDDELPLGGHKNSYSIAQN